MTRYLTHVARMCLLTAGILMAVQALVSARPTRTGVHGTSDITETDGEIVRDPAGNSHIKQLVQRGNFELCCGDFAIHGTQVLVLNGVFDETGSGPIAGSFTVTAQVNGVETVLWEGTVHGTLLGLHFSGEITAHGQGAYAGLILTLYIEEAEIPEVFALTGSILNPHG